MTPTPSTASIVGPNCSNLRVERDDRAPLGTRLATLCSRRAKFTRICCLRVRTNHPFPEIRSSGASGVSFVAIMRRCTSPLVVTEVPQDAAVTSFDCNSRTRDRSIPVINSSARDGWFSLLLSCSLSDTGRTVQGRDRGRVRSGGRNELLLRMTACRSSAMTVRQRRDRYVRFLILAPILFRKSYSFLGRSQPLHKRIQNNES